MSRHKPRGEADRPGQSQQGGRNPVRWDLSRPGEIPAAKETW